MKLECDPIADAAYFELSSTTVTVTKEIERGVMGDFDADGHLVGIEVLAIRKRRESDQLRQAI